VGKAAKTCRSLQSHARGMSGTASGQMIFLYPPHPKNSSDAQGDLLSWCGRQADPPAGPQTRSGEGGMGMGSGRQSVMDRGWAEVVPA
jgi:hypothetical protein